MVRLTPRREPSLVVSGSGIVGLAFGPGGNVILATTSSIYDVALGIDSLPLSRGGDSETLT